jgi:hypothetical protein
MYSIYNYYKNYFKHAHDGPTKIELLGVLVTLYTIEHVLLKHFLSP